MNRNASIFAFLVITLATFGGCSNQPSAEQAKKAKTAPDRIQGKAQVLPKSGGGADAALSAGESIVYLWEGTRRYRLFLRTAAEIVRGSEYVAEGVNAQKVIDEIGDPDQGKNGYPLMSSCKRAVRMAWSSQAFDEVDAQAEVLHAAVKRYPARPVFLVTKIRLATSTESSTAAAERKKDAVAEAEDIPEVSVAGDKQRAFLIEGPSVQPAPLWEPAGRTVHCKVIINQEGKISELESGTQLCEAVPWSQFRYKPSVQRGHPVTVKTEVEVRFEARK
jgi:hypothetical protein